MYKKFCFNVVHVQFPSPLYNIYIHEFSKDFQYLMVYLNLCLSRTTSQFTWHSNGHQYISFVYPIVCLQESDYWMYNVLCSKIKYIFQHLNCFGFFFTFGTLESEFDLMLKECAVTKWLDLVKGHSRSLLNSFWSLL